jgi:hypothetical protein
VVDGCRHPTEVGYWVGRRAREDRFTVEHDFGMGELRADRMTKVARGILKLQSWSRTNAGRSAIAKGRIEVRRSLNLPDEDDDLGGMD